MAVVAHDRWSLNTSGHKTGFTVHKFYGFCAYVNKYCVL